MVQLTICVSLKTGLKIAAIIDILLSTVMTALSVLGIVYFEQHKEEMLNFFADPPPQLSPYLDLTPIGEITFLICLGFSILYWLPKIWLGYVLYRAAVEENNGKCRTWIIGTFILLGFSVAFFLASICMQIVQLMAIPFYIVVFLIREYAIWILFKFKGKLEDGKSPLLVNASEFTNL